MMRFAEKWRRPVITLIDVPGAYPGLGAEERGQAEAIAHNLREMARLKVPFIAAITGEGGSGGALAIAVADRVLMMENSVYSVISPEGCASIMWRDSGKRELAAQAMRITAKDNLEMGFCDEVITEPMRRRLRHSALRSRRILQSLRRCRSAIARRALSEVPQDGAVLRDRIGRPEIRLVVSFIPLSPHELSS